MTDSILYGGAEKYISPYFWPERIPVSNRDVVDVTVLTEDNKDLAIGNRPYHLDPLYDQLPFRWLSMDLDEVSKLEIYHDGKLMNPQQALAAGIKYAIDTHNAYFIGTHTGFEKFWGHGALKRRDGLILSVADLSHGTKDHGPLATVDLNVGGSGVMFSAIITFNSAVSYELYASKEGTKEKDSRTGRLEMHSSIFRQWPFAEVVVHEWFHVLGFTHSVDTDSPRHFRIGFLEPPKFPTLNDVVLVRDLMRNRIDLVEAGTV